MGDYQILGRGIQIKQGNLLRTHEIPDLKFFFFFASFRAKTCTDLIGRLSQLLHIVFTIWNLTSLSGNTVM